METISLTFAALVGFGHAFEADHLLAVSTLVSKSNSTRQVVRNGAIWGLGHTSTIFLIGLFLIVFNVQALKTYFPYLELFVGVMLLFLGVRRLIKKTREEAGAHAHAHTGEAYGIGLVHGLAGSGGLVLLVLTQLESSWDAMLYLLLFGLGSAAGMACAATILRLPLLAGKAELLRNQIFSWIAGSLCIAYGVYIIWPYLIGA